MTHDQEREAFEKWHREEFPDCENYLNFKNGAYCWTSTNRMWNCWQAAKREPVVSGARVTLYLDKNGDWVPSPSAFDAIRGAVFVEETPAAKREPVVTEAVYQWREKPSEDDLDPPWYDCKKVEQGFMGRDCETRTLFTHSPEAMDAVVVDTRILELAERLVSPGAKASNVSASECHEISDFIFDLHAKTTTPRGG